MAIIGSKPATKFRGDPAIFGDLVDDHDTHRVLLAQLAATRGASEERTALFEELTFELKGHAAAEEQALWSTVLRIPEITEDGRHAVAEHKDIDDMLNDLAATDAASRGWLNKFKQLRDKYLHHIKEEEQELFVSVEKQLTADDKAYMASVFQRRNAVEKAQAELTPEKKKDAKH